MRMKRILKMTKEQWQNLGTDLIKDIEVANEVSEHLWFFGIWGPTSQICKVLQKSGMR